MSTTTPIVETPRLRMRSIVMDDVPALLAMYDRPETMQWLGADPLTSQDDAARLVEFIQQGWQLPIPDLRWGIERRDAPGQLIGTGGFRLWDTGARHCQFGYEIDWRHRQRGFAFEALTALLAWGFRYMQLHRVNALVHLDNLPSQRLLRRMGFEVEGLMREGGFWGARHHDLLQYGLMRSEFTAATLNDPAPQTQPASEPTALAA